MHPRHLSFAPKSDRLLGYYFGAGTHGISVFFPETAAPSGSGVYYNYTDRSANPANLALCADTAWDRFLRAYLELRAIRVTAAGVAACPVACTTDDFGESGGSAPFTILHYPGDTVTLRAAPQSEGKAFFRWHVDGSDEPIGMTNLTVLAADRNVVAEYRNAYSIEVSSAHGPVEPALGRTDGFQDWPITNRVGSPVLLGTTQFVCTGWVMTGQEPTTGSTNLLVLSLTNSAALTWNWRTNYWLALNSNGNGSLNLGNGWQERGCDIPLAATADRYYHFRDWSGSGTGAIVAGGTLASNIVVRMADPVELTASFDANLAVNGTPEWWLARHGWTGSFDAAAMSDTDQDGSKAWQEHVADTDPTNAASCFRIVAVSNLPPWRVYFDSSSTGRQYTLHWTTNLAVGVWTNDPGRPAAWGQGGRDAMTDTNAASPARFYRLDVRLP